MRSVNLTPPDKKRLAGEKPKAEGRKIGPVHMAGIGILVAAAGLAYYAHGIKGEAAHKADEAASLETQVQGIQTQITALKAAQTPGASPSVSSYDADRTLVSGLAAARVNWSNVTINLARVAPSGVWLTSMKVQTPTGDQSAASSSSGTAVERPAAITIEGKSLSRTSAALFLSRLSAIPGFAEPRLNGGIDPDSSGDSSSDSSSTGPATYGFTIEIPVDDRIFGSVRPVVPGATSTSAASSTTTPAQP